MNALVMQSGKTVYALEIYQLTRPYRSPENLQAAAHLHSYESTASFGVFHVGDSLSHGLANCYVGTIQHVHHRIAEDDSPNVVHRTLLYVFNG